MRRLALLVLLAAPVAAAGSADAPELADAAGDCALPYGGAYLDLAGAWVEQETEVDLQVALRLHEFDATLAEGAGYAVQFQHQGTKWGVVAMHRPVSDGGWSFFTGLLEAEDAHVDTFRPAQGRFDEATATILVPFPKSLFPHDDPEDRALRAFYAASADLRSAYPFFLATDGIDPDSSDGKWLLCDEGASDATYVFAVGRHGDGHVEHAEPTAAAPEPEARVEEAKAPAAEPTAARETPAGAWVALAAGGVALLRRSSARP